MAIVPQVSGPILFRSCALLAHLLSACGISQNIVALHASGALEVARTGSALKHSEEL